MAKIKVRPRAGALSELLKTKGMTKLDAKPKTGVDRKTLLRIDRGEEVKLETLQKVANKLGVTEEFFRLTAEVTAHADDPEPGTILLRKVDTSRLEELLAGAERVKWHLNAKVRDDGARKFLEDLEIAVQNLREQRERASRESETLSLRLQLDRLKTADDIAARFERLAELRLALLGADHLFWECSSEDHSYEDMRWSSDHYHSSKTVLLSVEPFGTQSRRVRMSYGNPPPFVAPDAETAIFVNGERLLSREEL